MDASQVPWALDPPPNNSFKPSPLRGLVQVSCKFHLPKAAKRPGLTQALAPMKTQSRTTIISLLLAASAPASACMPVSPSDEFAREGRNILVGTVESTRFAERPANTGGIPLTSSNSRSQAAPEFLVKVKTLEVLGGKAPAVVTAISPCHLPLQVGERVVVATYNNRRVVFPAEMYEQSYRSAHTSGR
jgi:hypothetical protein